MNDYYLKASSKSALENALLGAGLATFTTTIRGVRHLVAHGVNIDVIGEIDGVDGYHCNLRAKSELTADQIQSLPIIQAPANPVRVWA